MSDKKLIGVAKSAANRELSHGMKAAIKASTQKPSTIQKVALKAQDVTDTTSKIIDSVKHGMQKKEEFEATVNQAMGTLLNNGENHD